MRTLAVLMLVFLAMGFILGGAVSVAVMSSESLGSYAGFLGVIECGIGLTLCIIGLLWADVIPCLRETSRQLAKMSSPRMIPLGNTRESEVASTMASRADQEEAAWSALQRDLPVETPPPPIPAPGKPPVRTRLVTAKRLQGKERAAARTAT